MKNSGIEWIGEIPDSWEMIPNKHLFLDHSQKVGEKWTNYKLLSLTTSGVKEKDINSTGGKIPDSYENYQTVVPGDMVFCLFDLDCSAVFSGLSAHSGMITSAYDVFAVNDNLIDEKYIDYWFQYVFSNRYYKMYSKNIRYTVTGETFGATLTPVPPIKTQRKIGVFLKNKCAEVDKLIEVQQAQIDKLKEYKQSVITEAVTKGLDPTVPMKDSGVEWIGMIPCEWKIIKVGSIFACRNEKVSDVDFAPLSVSRGGVVPQMENVAKSDAGDNRKLVLKNDFVINSRSDRKQSCGVSPLDGSVSLINTVLYPVNDDIICPEYTNIIMKNYGFAEEFYRWGHGIVADLWTTRWQEMKNIVLPLPSIKIQSEIVKAVIQKINTINSLIALKQAKIDKLQEYKKSLIYEYVTGKKEVM